MTSHFTGTTKKREDGVTESNVWRDASSDDCEKQAARVQTWRAAADRSKCVRRVTRAAVLSGGGGKYLQDAVIKACVAIKPALADKDKGDGEECLTFPADDQVSPRVNHRWAAWCRWTTHLYTHHKYSTLNVKCLTSHITRVNDVSRQHQLRVSAS